MGLHGVFTARRTRRAGTNLLEHADRVEDDRAVDGVPRLHSAGRWDIAGLAPAAQARRVRLLGARAGSPCVVCEEQEKEADGGCYVWGE